MSPDEFRLVQLVIRFVDESNKLIIETAELMDKMNKILEELASK